MTDEPRAHGLVETVLDLVVYAPIGALDMLRDAPRIVADRRRDIEQRVRTARWIGEMAVNVGRQKVTQRLSSLRPPSTPSTSPTPTTTHAAATPSSADRQPVASGSGEPAGTPVMPSEPFHGYDALPASELVQLLFRLTRTELETVRDYELATRARRTVLAKVEQLLGTA